MVDNSVTASPAGRIRTPSQAAVTVMWWLATLVTLVILDDLTFGPVFWLISRLGSPIAGFLAALVIYVPVQVGLVWAATSGDPGRAASFLLRRLDLERRSQNVADREQRLHRRITGAASAVALSFVVGGVLPPLVLWRSGFSTRFVRRLSLVTASAYAVEFSLVHGFLPGTL